MCGYCVEIGVALNFIEQESKNDEAEYYSCVDICLQESKNFPEIISKLKSFDNFPECIAITFCRIWDKFLFQKYDKRYQLLISGLDDESTNFFLHLFVIIVVTEPLNHLGIRNSMLIANIGSNL